MADENKQLEYEQQDQTVENKKSDEGCNAAKCCCDYIKWSFKAACKMCECTAQCMTC